MSLLAAIGQVESGSLVGRPIDREHRTSVLGPVLDGTASPRSRTPTAGGWDGDTTWDRAVGPMQFLPGTWRAFGVDGDGDGVANPQDVEDAAAGTAAYLCYGGRDLSEPAALRTAVLSYNHSVAYLRLVLTYQQRFTPLDSAAVDLPTVLALTATPIPAPSAHPRQRREARREQAQAGRHPHRTHAPGRRRRTRHKTRGPGRSGDEPKAKIHDARRAPPPRRPYTATTPRAPATTPSTPAAPSSATTPATHTPTTPSAPGRPRSRPPPDTPTGHAEPTPTPTPEDPQTPGTPAPTDGPTCPTAPLPGRPLLPAVPPDPDRRHPVGPGAAGRPDLRAVPRGRRPDPRGALPAADDGRPSPWTPRLADPSTAAPSSAQ